MSTTYMKSGGREGAVNLGETNNPTVITRADAALKSILNPKREPGNVRPVRVVEVTDYFREKYGGKIKAPRAGQQFPSTMDASLAIGAHLASVTTALSHAKRRGDTVAIVRGIKFAFA